MAKRNQAVAEPPANPKFKFDESHTYRLRRHRGDNFNGLWELSKIDEKTGKALIISDADALNFCLDNLMGDLEAGGF